MIYNVVLVSGVQQSDLVTHISILFHIGYYRVLSRVPCLYSRSLLISSFHLLKIHLFIHSCKSNNKNKKNVLSAHDVCQNVSKTEKPSLAPGASSLERESFFKNSTVTYNYKLQLLF